MFRMQRRRISAKNSFIERPSEHSSYYLLWCSPHFIINNNLLFLFRCLSHFLSHSSLALCALCDSVEFSHLRIGTANELFDEFAMSIRLTARLNNRGTCGRDVYWRLCVYDAHSAHAFHHCVRLYLCVCVCGTCWSRTIHSYRRERPHNSKQILIYKFECSAAVYFSCVNDIAPTELIFEPDQRGTRADNCFTRKYEQVLKHQNIKDKK